MALTREQLNDYWPDVWFGDKHIRDIDTTGVDLEDIDEDAATPEVVIAMLGFDPDKLSDDEEIP
jgi:hypothetical protein